MYKSTVIFEKEEYKLKLIVCDHVNDYGQLVFVAKLELYTKDNLFIIGENYLFPTLTEKVNNSVTLAHDYYLDHLQSRYEPRTLAYDLYLRALRENNPFVKNL